MPRIGDKQTSTRQMKILYFSRSTISIYVSNIEHMFNFQTVQAGVRLRKQGFTEDNQITMVSNLRVRSTLTKRINVEEAAAWAP